MALPCALALLALLAVRQVDWVESTCLSFVCLFCLLFMLLSVCSFCLRLLSARRGLAKRSSSLPSLTNARTCPHSISFFTRRFSRLSSFVTRGPPLLRALVLVFHVVAACTAFTRELAAVAGTCRLVRWRRANGHVRRPWQRAIGRGRRPFLRTAWRARREIVLLRFILKGALRRHIALGRVGTSRRLVLKRSIETSHRSRAPRPCGN